MRRDIHPLCDALLRVLARKQREHAKIRSRCSADLNGSLLSIAEAVRGLRATSASAPARKKGAKLSHASSRAATGFCSVKR